ncbi:MAG: dihydrolipoyl dehydrogenase [Spirochaetaceae bacterium]|nr:dihydrolipoyl dehydrogenase [Spirochaetaceae bacterium]
MYDLLILGGGPGGYVAAERAGAAGLKVLLVERDRLGGTCLNRGCIPTKSLLAGAKLYKHAKEGAKYGLKAEGLAFDFPAAMAWKEDVVQKLRAGIDFSMKKHGVEVYSGSGRLASERRVVLDDGREIEARHVMIATGSSPALPPIPGLKDNPKVVTSDGLLSLTEPPARLVVVGGGVIGVEFASFFAAIGTKVTVVEMLPEILPFMDRELVGVYRRTLRGVTIETGARVGRIEGGTVHYERNGEAKIAEGDLVLVATGRRPNVDGIGLEEAGVAFSPKGVTVDDELRTNRPGVWAVGDVTGRALLAHSASAMGEAAVDGILGKPRSIAWKAIPWVVYGDPECAGVGMTEEEAKASGLDCAKVLLPARVSGRFLAENGQAAQGAVKLLAEKGTGRLLGATLVTPYAGEMVWGLQPLVARGAKAEELKGMIFPHPTVSELLREAAWELEG